MLVMVVHSSFGIIYQCFAIHFVTIILLLFQWTFHFPFLTHGSSEGRKVSHCYRSRCCYGEPTLPAWCSSRLLLLLCSLVSTIYSIWMKLPSDEVAQFDISAKWLECVEVCFSFNRTCAFSQLWWRHLMNKVICFVDRRSTHRYHLFV